MKRDRGMWLALWLTLALFWSAVGGLAYGVWGFAYPVELLSLQRGHPLELRDRYGTLLRSVPHPQGRPGRQAWVPLREIPNAALLTLVASEDLRFYQHRGVDPLALWRAAWLNLQRGRLAFGGSTLTMQLVRMLHSRGKARTLWRKLYEAALALRLERVASKPQILEQYFNRAYYGHGAYGLGAAAQTYFDKPAQSLSLGEVTLLCALPRSPRLYDPFAHLSRLRRRRDHLLALLQKQGWLQPKEARFARSQILDLVRKRPPFRAPHFVDWLLRRLPASLRRRGGVLHSTLDLPLQHKLQRRLQLHIDGLKHRGLRQAAVVILETQSGEIRAMLGSRSYRSPGGQLNMTTRRQRPGSALKPFLYALALESGDHPATITYELQLPSEPEPLVFGSFRPRGPVRYREALGNSYNLSAVRVIRKLGVGRFWTRLQRAGLGPFPAPPFAYGPRLALGAAKVRLYRLALALGFTVRGGKVTQARGISRLRFAQGPDWTPPPPKERQAFSALVSWQIMDILSDPGARRTVFGPENPFDLPYKIVAKTGTMQGFHSTLAIGVTREYTVAAWAGRLDGKPMRGITGIKGAAPLVRAGFQLLRPKGRLTLPPRPKGLKDLAFCSLSGARANDHCPHRVLEPVIASRKTPPLCTWHRRKGGKTTTHFPPALKTWASHK